jgi:4-azaleucine resistance transporter AzlC
LYAGDGVRRRLEYYRPGLVAAAPFAPAVLLFGVSFGVLAEAAGIGGTASIVMSATTFGGASQFAVASILSAGGGLAAAIAAALMLNARYGAIGLAVARDLEGGPLRRALKAQLVVDESWALSAREEGGYDPRVLLGAGMLLYSSWLTGTTVGVLAGDVIGDPEKLGLDAAFPALFLGLLVPQVRSRLDLAAAFAGVAIALALVPFTPPGVPIVASAAACLLGWGRGRAAGEAS